MGQVRFVILVGVAVVAIAACGGGATTTSVDPTEVIAGDAANGEVVYKSTCAPCHGVDAMGIDGIGVPLVDSVFVASRSEDQLADFIKEGRPSNDPDNTTGIAMPPFDGIQRITAQDLLDVSAYLLALNQ